MTSHRLAPIFVVADTEQKPIPVDKIPYIFMHIEVGAVIDLEALAFQPTDERKIPMPEGLPRRRWIVGIREIVIPGPAANAATGPAQGQRAVSSSIQAAAGIAEVVVSVVCEQRQFVEYSAVSFAISYDEQRCNVPLVRIGGVMSTRTLNGHKPRDVRPRFPIARDRIFVDRPVPIAVRSTERPGLGEHRFRPRLQHQGFPLPIEPDLEPYRRVGRYMEPQYLARENARAVRV